MTGTVLFWNRSLKREVAQRTEALRVNEIGLEALVLNGPTTVVGTLSNFHSGESGSDKAGSVTSLCGTRASVRVAMSATTKPLRAPTPAMT